MNNRFIGFAGYAVLLICVLITSGCGDGKTCDCCSEKKDCEFGLQCVDLIGGTGKVCGSAGINYCSEDACTAKSSSLYDGRIEVPILENNGTYAIMNTFKDPVENEESPDGGIQK